MEIDMRIRRELTVFFQSVRCTTMTRLVDPVAFSVLGFSGVVRMALGIIFFTSIYSKVKSIGGWSLSEVLVLIGTCELIHTFSWSFYVRGGFRRMPRLIEYGGLDQMMMWPVKLRRYFVYDNSEVIFMFPQYVLAVSLIIYGAMQAREPLHVVGYLILLFLSVLLHYSLVCLVAAICIWSPNEQLSTFLEELMRFGRYPDSIYTGSAHWFFLLAVPIICLFAFPVRALFGHLSYAEWGLVLGVVTAFWFGVKWFWEFSLRRYESSNM